MKSVLISIQPKWCELIANGKKTVEVRKTKPKIDVPFKCYIYATRPKNWFRFSSFGYASDESLWLANGKVKMCDGFEFWADEIEYKCLNQKVIGEFVCKNIDFLNERDLFEGMDEISNSRIEEFSCVSIDELLRYKGKKQEIYGWHISDLVIYDKPKELSEFYQKCKSYDKDEWDIDNLDCIDCENPCGNGGKLYLKRPPQSWCYVEKGATDERN